jgi:hypothetical protein
MKAKWSGVVFLMTTALLAQNLDAGKKADQLRDLANQAKSSKDIQGEANYFCQAAALDDKKYGKKCSQAKDELSKMLAQFQADLAMGNRELQQKDYAGALRDLQKIAFGPNKAEAQELIQQAHIGINGGIPVDPASLAAFKSAREAYLRGDFDSAESQLKPIQSPPLHTAVNQMLTNISIYRDTMKQADAMFQSGDLKGAEQKYKFAVAIQQNGPGSPLDRLRDVLAAEAQAEVAKQQAPPVDSHSASQGKSTQSAKMSRAAKSRSASETAHRQTEADAGKKAVPENLQEDPKEVADSLNTGVADFYASHFPQAEDAIGAYLGQGGKHYAGAAHFYLGASLSMQALLAAPQNQPQVDALHKQAQDQFLLAKQLHYRPIESAVSPKVLAQWTQVGDQ